MPFKYIISVNADPGEDDRLWHSFEAKQIVNKWIAKETEPIPDITNDDTAALKVMHGIRGHKRLAILMDDALPGIDVVMLHGLMRMPTWKKQCAIKIELKFFDDKVKGSERAVFAVVMHKVVVVSFLTHDYGWIFNFQGKGGVETEDF